MLFHSMSALSGVREVPRLDGGGGGRRGADRGSEKGLPGLGSRFYPNSPTRDSFAHSQNLKIPDWPTDRAAPRPRPRPHHTYTYSLTRKDWNRRRVVIISFPVRILTRAFGHGKADSH